MQSQLTSFPARCIALSLGGKLNAHRRPALLCFTTVLSIAQMQAPPPSHMVAPSEGDGGVRDTIEDSRDSSYSQRPVYGHVVH